MRGSPALFRGVILPAVLLALVLSGCNRDGGGGGVPGTPVVPLGLLHLDQPPASVNTPDVTLTGMSDVPGSAIAVEGGAAPVMVTAGANRAFAVTVSLLPDRLNRLFLTETTPSSEVRPAVTVEIVQDGVAPTLFIDFPPDGSDL